MHGSNDKAWVILSKEPGFETFAEGQLMVTVVSSLPTGITCITCMCCCAYNIITISQKQKFAIRQLHNM